MREFWQNNKELINKAAFLLLFVLGIYFFVNTLFAYVAPFAIGYVISIMLEPLVGLLHRKFRIPRGISGIILIITVITLLIVLGTSIVTRVAVEARAFAENLPRYIENSRELIVGLQEEIDRYIDIVPEGIQTIINDSSGNVIATVTSSLTAFLGTGVGQGGLNLVRGLPNALVFIILCIISAFFFTKDKHIVEKSIKANMPEWIKGNFRSIREGVFIAIIGYIKAQLIIMSVTGLVSVVGLTVLRYPYALLIGLLIAVFDALPIFGSGAIMWPWALYNVLTQNYGMAIGLMITYGAIFLTRQFLEPKVLASQIGIHPLLTLMSMYIGLRVFGVLGFMIGPFVIISIKIIMESDIGAKNSDGDGQEVNEESGGKTEEQ